MRRIIIAAAFGGACLAGCDQQSAEPVGKYVIYQEAGVAGSIRLNTVTGEAHMLIPSDTEMMHNGVTLNGKPLVWRKIANSNAN
ncbi:hypothetical protein [Brevundimonas phoenicis]|uniref:hypothetical protein n=1 Tax=unclassified Brevundimonas TaxID=2622653 RepID=UPI00399EF1DD